MGDEGNSTTTTATSEGGTSTEESKPTGETQSTTTTEGKDLEAEVEKWKELSRKNEERAKANAGAAKELEELKKTTMSDTDKAIEAARKEGATEAAKKAGARLVDAEVKAAAAGRKVDVAALLEGLDRSRFLTEDGEPDTKAIEEWVEKVAPEKGETPDLGQGSRNGGKGGGGMNDVIRDRMRR